MWMFDTLKDRKWRRGRVMKRSTNGFTTTVCSATETWWNRKKGAETGRDVVAEIMACWASGNGGHWTAQSEMKGDEMRWTRDEMRWDKMSWAGGNELMQRMLLRWWSKVMKLKKPAGMSRMKLKRERSILVEERCRAGDGWMQEAESWLMKTECRERNSGWWRMNAEPERRSGWKRDNVEILLFEGMRKQRKLKKLLSNNLRRSLFLLLGVWSGCQEVLARRESDHQWSCQNCFFLFSSHLSVSLLPSSSFLFSSLLFFFHLPPPPRFLFFLFSSLHLSVSLLPASSSFSLFFSYSFCFSSSCSFSFNLLFLSFFPFLRFPYLYYVSVFSPSMSSFFDMISLLFHSRSFPCFDLHHIPPIALSSKNSAWDN